MQKKHQVEVRVEGIFGVADAIKSFRPHAVISIGANDEDVPGCLLGLGDKVCRLGFEGLYIKIEKNGEVVDRLKWVRPVFLQTILESGSHWHNRPIIRNGLATGVDILALPEQAELSL